VRKEWLQKMVTAAEVEAAHMVHDERLGPDPVPFGFKNERWRALLAQMEVGDELWEFRSPVESWEHLAGRAGIAVVRQGEIINFIVTMMN